MFRSIVNFFLLFIFFVFMGYKLPLATNISFCITLIICSKKTAANNKLDWIASL